MTDLVHDRATGLWLSPGARAARHAANNPRPAGRRHHLRRWRWPWQRRRQQHAMRETEQERDERRKLHRLRDLRAITVDLQSALSGVRSGSADFQTLGPYITRLHKYLLEMLKEIESFEAVSHPDNADSDALVHLRDVCEEIGFSPLLAESAPEISAEQQLRWLTSMEASCDQIILEVGCLTIPDRLNQWLASARSGYYIPFHAVFDDELPREDHRLRILRYLAAAPKSIPQGLVDPASGLIYRVSTERSAQSLYMLGALASVAAATLVVYFAPQLLEPMGWTPDSSTNSLLGPWAALLAGVVVHVAIATAKRLQGQNELPPVLALGDVPRMITAKFGQFVLKVLLALVGLFALVLGAGSAGAGALSAFLTGYTLDSFIGLFAVSVEQRAAAETATLKQQLGVASSGS